MTTVFARLSYLALLLLPLLCLIWLTFRRRWRAAPLSENLLAALVATPFLLIAGIVALGTLIPGRPLKSLPYLQPAVSLICAALVVHRRPEFRAALHDLSTTLRASLRASAWLTRALLLLTTLAGLAAALYGVWNVPSAHDELGYHFAQIMQPYQDGRMARVEELDTWADSYPRGVELLYYWTFELSRTDAGFHPVNAAFGMVFLLAVYVAARRLRLNEDSALLAVGLAGSAPVFLLLFTIGYIDVPVAAALAAALAFSLPQREGGWDRANLVLLSLASILTLWMKFPPIALIGFLFAYRLFQAITAYLPRRNHLAGAPQPRAGAIIAAGFATLALASPPYFWTWCKYGSPVFPARITLFGRTVIAGPMKMSNLIALPNRPVYERLVHYWTGWEVVLNADSRGGLGPLFLYALLPALCIVGLWALFQVISRNRRTDTRPVLWLFLIAAFWFTVLLPAQQLCRYSLVAILPTALCTAFLATALRPGVLRHLGTLALFGLTVWNCWLPLDELKTQFVRQSAEGNPLFTAQRNRLSRNKIRYYVWGSTPETRRVLYQQMHRGETLVSAVEDFYALLFDPHYTYRVEHRPAVRWSFGQSKKKHMDFGAAHVDDWLAGLQRDHIAAALVYRDSCEGQALAAEASGYTCVYTQPESDGLVIQIYRRTDTTPSPHSPPP